MKKVIHIIVLSAIPILSLFSQSCGDKKSAGSNQIISVSIEPVKFITEQIVGSDFDINVLVPSGASPETYEPTVTQMAKTANSLFYINIGLIDFEKHLTESIAANNPDVRIISLNKNIALIEGEHGHGKSGNSEERKESADADVHNHDHNISGTSDSAAPHSHGVDPHIWASPKCLKQMAATLYFDIMNLYPDSTKYTANYNLFIAKLNLLDYEIGKLFAEEPDAKKTFIIYHPALTYLARDYGLTQIAVEDEGKEPSANHIRDIIDIAKKEKITRLFYQRQFSKATVDALAEELGIEAVEIDPLSGDVINNTLYMSRLIAGNDE